jgi:RNA polymerase sigma factor (TIGR02999 family)
MPAWTDTTGIPLTNLLNDWQSGNQDARDQVFDKLYVRLKALCLKQLSSESPKRVEWVATELLHELYLRLEGQTKPWLNRAQFYAACARIVRQIVVDHIRRRSTAKRSGIHIPYLEDSMGGSTAPPLDELDQALDCLEERYPNQALVFELHYFLGLTFAQIAEEISITPAQSKWLWKKANLSLKRFLSRR